MTSSENQGATLIQFYVEMSESPDDWGLRGIFADWCEDEGLERWCRFLRWTLENRKRPLHHNGYDRWSFYDWVYTHQRHTDPESDIIHPLFKGLSGGRLHQNNVFMAWREYPSMLNAEADLKQSLESCDYEFLDR